MPHLMPNPEKTAIFSHTLYQFIGKAIGLCLVLGSTVILRRYLDREQYGNYAFIFSLVTLFSIVADFGTRLTVVPQAGRRPQHESRFLGVALTVRFWMTALILVIYLGTVAVFPVEASLKPSMAVAGLLLFVFWLRDTLYMILAVRMRLKWYALIELTTAFFSFVAVAVAVWLQQSLMVVFGLISCFALAGMLPFIGCRSVVGPLQWIVDRRQARQLIKQSYWIFLSLLLFNLTTQAPQIGLKIVRSAGDLGILGLAYRVYENGLLPAALLMNTCLPVLGKRRLYSSRSHPLVQSAYDGVVLLGITVGAGMALLAPWGTYLLTGKMLTPEIEAIRYLAVIILVAYLNHFFGFFLLSQDRYQEVVYSKIAGLAVALPLLWPLLVKYGYHGALIYYLLAETVVLAYSINAVRRKIGILPQPFHFPITLTATIKRLIHHDR